MLNDFIIHRKALIVFDHASQQNHVLQSAIARLQEALADQFIDSETAASYEEARLLADSTMDIDCFLLCSSSEDASVETQWIIHMKARQGDVPVFLLADRAKTIQAISADLMKLAAEFIWILEDSPEFIAGRIAGAIGRFRKHLLPPLMSAICEYNETHHEYSWAAPGHQGGVGFTKSPVGKKFYDFYGENLFRTDTGIERTSIGSLLDHSGAFAASEELAARTFGADRSFSVVAGTSGSNRTIMQICLAEGETAVCDRNCHKSIEQGLILTGAKPVYLLPTRNCYGIIGPIPPSEMTPQSIQAKIQRSPLYPDPDKNASYAVVTNCTYDGICYNALKAELLLAQSAKRIHFDEAWYAYARFHPVYKDHYAMRGNPADHRGPTVFATHSTHKLLNALSQASYIHIRQGKDPISFARFNQAYMMHATTSPLYAICASNDIASAMMYDSGESLISEVIAEAVDFRQALARLYRDFARQGTWFFRPWNNDRVTDPRSGKSYHFADAPRELLIRQQSCWKLAPGESWHGFNGLADEWVMLDPIKVSILGPGMSEDGVMQDHGVPAALVANYIYYEGIVPTRTTDFQLMFLFSMGITKGKWGTLLNALLNFKRLYDANTPVKQALPELAEAYPDVYGKIGLHDLGDKMFDYLRRKNPGSKLNKAFSQLPEQVLTPREAFGRIVTGDVENVPLSSLAGRVAANSLIPYPPGIPLLMSGENFGDAESPQIEYLKALNDYDRNFPGFEHDTEGLEVVDGEYQVMCIKS